MSKISKAIKILIAIDILMFAIGIILWFATKNANDFSGLVVVYPLIGFTVITVCILVLLFIYSFKISLQSEGMYKPYWAIPLLVGIPLLGLFYAHSGDNRGKLLIICVVLLLLGIGSSIKLLLKRK